MRTVYCSNRNSLEFVAASAVDTIVQSLNTRVSVWLNFGQILIGIERNCGRDCGWNSSGFRPRSGRNPVTIRPNPNHDPAELQSMLVVPRTREGEEHCAFSSRAQVMYFSSSTLRNLWDLLMWRYHIINLYLSD